MSDEPENLVLRYLRRIDERVGGLALDILDVKSRLGSSQQQVSNIHSEMAVIHTDLIGVSADITRIDNRIDRVDARLARIEKRLDLTPA
jgi:septal ring factor EnvC (AmiA/AmiB activator)